MRWIVALMIWGIGVFGVAASDIENRIRTQCFHCHGSEKLCVDTDDILWWEHAVARMVLYEDGLLRPEEVATMAAWLSQKEHRRLWCQ